MHYFYSSLLRCVLCVYEKGQILQPLFQRSSDTVENINNRVQSPAERLCLRIKFLQSCSKPYILISLIQSWIFAKW